MSRPYNITQHVITVMVEDKPGVLARISSMFARRGFNIHSLAVGPTVDPQLSRMTVVADGPEIEKDASFAHASEDRQRPAPKLARQAIRLPPGCFEGERDGGAR